MPAKDHRISQRYQAGRSDCPASQDFQNPQTGLMLMPPLGLPDPGIVTDQIDPTTRRPVFSGNTTQTVASRESFEAWYIDDENCTKTFEYELPMELDPVTGNLVYDNARFFPLDGLDDTFGVSGADEDGVMRNFHFTFELHMRFVYQGGEVFNFRGDDDLFVYINDELVIDLGGVHAPMEASVALDALGLTPGEEYPIDFFHAERQTEGSNFRIETSLAFSNCEAIPPVPVVVR